MEYKSILEKLYTEVEALKDDGKVATYIPELAKIDHTKFGVFLQPTDKEGCGVGDYKEKFSIQSISKILLLLLHIEHPYWQEP